MCKVRAALCWFFLIEALLLFSALFESSSVSRVTGQRLPQFSSDPFYYGFAFCLILLLVAAWLTVWMGKKGAKWWAVAASVLNLLTALVGIECSIAMSIVLCVAGVAGLIVFIATPKEGTRPVGFVRPERLPGDGTSPVGDVIVPIVELSLASASVMLWNRWATAKAIDFMLKNPLAIIPMFFLALNLGFAVRECGKALTVRLLGMKLRSLWFCPFFWVWENDRWKFTFHPLRVLGLGGATSFFPTEPKFSRSKWLMFSVAGLVANLVLGLAAMLIADYAHHDSPVQFGGLLFGFGCCSVLLGLIALLPYQRHEGYTPCAMVYQLLGDGPCAQFWNSFHQVLATVVTGFRPRDYDVAPIESAAQAITSGARAAYLRVWIYSHYLDQGEMAEASAALRSALALRRGASAGFSAGFDSLLVFGAAWLMRDASAARECWEAIEKNLGGEIDDVLRAKCALDWIEGNQKAANDRWGRWNAWLNKKPQFGQYQYDRHLNALMREAIDASAAG